MRIGIVGGGITGLALTHALARRRVESVLFERSERFGGVIQTRREGGRILELGPQRTRLVEPVRRLIGELGLADQVIEAKPGAGLFIWTRGRLRRVPRSPADLMTSDLLTWPGRARAVVEPLTSGLRSGESVATYFRRKTGDEAYRILFGPLVSATFGSDPEAMPAHRALPMILGPLGVRRSLFLAARRWRSKAGSAACTFRGGMGALTDSLGARHARRIRLGTTVEHIGRAGARFEISFSGSLSGSERVDAIVITAAAFDAARLLESVAPDAAKRLATLAYNQVCVVPLEVDSPPPEGFGFQVALGERWRTRGVTWTASLFGRPGVCAAYLGGGLDPEVESWSDERVGELAAEEYHAIHGARARPLLVSRPRLPAYDDTWKALDGLEVPSGIVLAANYSARLGISSRIAEAEATADRLARGGASG